MIHKKTIQIKVKKNHALFFLNFDLGVAFFFGFRVGLVDCKAGDEKSFLLGFSICFIYGGGFGGFEAGEWGVWTKVWQNMGCYQYL